MCAPKFQTAIYSLASLIPKTICETFSVKPSIDIKKLVNRIQKLDLFKVAQFPLKSGTMIVHPSPHS